MGRVGRADMRQGSDPNSMILLGSEDVAHRLQTRATSDLPSAFQNILRQVQEPEAFTDPIGAPHQAPMPPVNSMGFSPPGRLALPGSSPPPARASPRSPGVQLTAASQAAGRAAPAPITGVIHAGDFQVDEALLAAYQRQERPDIHRSPTRGLRRDGSRYTRRTTPAGQAHVPVQQLVVVPSGAGGSTPGPGTTRNTAINPLADLLKTAKPAPALRGGFGGGRTSTPLGRQVHRRQASNFRQPALGTPGGASGSTVPPNNGIRNSGYPAQGGYPTPQTVPRTNSRFADRGPSGDNERMQDVIVSSDEDDPGNGALERQFNVQTLGPSAGGALGTPVAAQVGGGFGAMAGGSAAVGAVAGTSSGAYGASGSRPAAQQDAFLQSIGPPSARNTQRQRSRLAGGAVGNGLQARLKRVRAADEDIAAAPPDSQPNLNLRVQGVAFEGGVVKIRGLCKEDGGATPQPALFLVTDGDRHIRDIGLAPGQNVMAYRPYRWVNRDSEGATQKIFACTGKLQNISSGAQSTRGPGARP